MDHVLERAAILLCNVCLLDIKPTPYRSDLWRYLCFVWITLSAYGRTVFYEGNCFLFCPQDVDDAIHILSRNRTCLIFTRRRKTVEAAHQIVFMYHGRVIEQGTLDELREQRRLYHLLTSLEDVEEL